MVIFIFSSNLLTPQIQDTVPKQERGDTDLLMFDYVTDMSSKVIIMVVDFAKKLPGFLTLSTQDQITLLKASCLEVMVRTINYLYLQSNLADFVCKL